MSKLNAGKNADCGVSRLKSHCASDAFRAKTGTPPRPNSPSNLKENESAELREERTDRPISQEEVRGGVDLEEV